MKPPSEMVAVRSAALLQAMKLFSVDPDNHLIQDFFAFYDGNVGVILKEFGAPGIFEQGVFEEKDLLFALRQFVAALEATYYEKGGERDVTYGSVPAEPGAFTCAQFSPHIQ